MFGFKRDFKRTVKQSNYYIKFNLIIFQLYYIYYDKTYFIFMNIFFNNNFIL